MSLPAQEWGVDRSTRRLRGRVETLGLSIARRLLALSHEVRSRRWQVVAVATGLWALAFAARLMSDELLPEGFPYITFFPAVLISGFLGGLACGAICAALSGLTAWYVFIAPSMSFAVSPAVIVALVYYALVVGAALVLIHFLFIALDETARDRARLTELLAQRTTLFTELQHRVANNLAFLSSLFGMQKRRFAGNPEAVAAFDDARLRLMTMARLHRRLYDPASSDLPFETMLRETLRDMLDAAGRTDVTLSLDVAPLPLAAESKMTLALFALEAAANALKHAFAGRSGRLQVTLAASGAGRASFCVRDDGPGWPEGAPPLAQEQGAKSRAQRSLGMRVLGSFATALQGELTLRTEGGATICIVFPLEGLEEAAPGGEGA